MYIYGDVDSGWCEAIFVGKCPKLRIRRAARDNIPNYLKFPCALKEWEGCHGNTTQNFFMLKRLAHIVNALDFYSKHTLHKITCCTIYDDFTWNNSSRENLASLTDRTAQSSDILLLYIDMHIRSHWIALDLSITKLWGSRVIRVSIF